MPLSLIAILIGVAWLFIYRPKFARVILSLAFLSIIFLSTHLSHTYLVSPLETSFTVNSKPINGKCYVMVLGSGHNDYTELPATQQLSNTALSRLIEGIRQTKLGNSCYLIVSGYKGHSVRSHAEVSAEAAEELGISKDRIIQFPLAKDTIEEAEYAKSVLDNHPFRLVTSATHMKRAMRIFKDKGLMPQAAPTDFAVTTQWHELSANYLLSAQKAMHEYIGMAWINIKGWFGEL
ncbi:hypothetical protein SOPP22_08140 [Shewanella sp. OPT22]|nr:hypothetical protein SOPP22_08140 [Shewanella sp. OPT22]